MRICKGAFIGFLVLMFTIPAWAADIVKLGFFDKQAIVDRSEMGKQGNERFKIELKKVDEKLKAEFQEIKHLEEEIKTKEVIWSDETKKGKVREFVAKQRRLQELEKQESRRLERIQQELLEPLRVRLFEIVARIGKEEGYTMIFELGNAGIIYAPNALNLTDRIIRELNEVAAKEASGQQ